jgi:transcriptional regulator with XRE-family HTH domain
MNDIEWYRDQQAGDEFWIEDAKVEFAVAMERIMKQSGLNKSALAVRLGTSPAYITKVLRGDANLTINSMVKLARAAGGSLHIHIAKEHSEVRWFDVVKTRQAGPELIHAAEAKAEIWANLKKTSHGPDPVAA